MEDLQVLELLLLHKKGLSTIVLSLVPVKRSHSAAAQGGMQASLGNSKMSDGDNEDLHFADTVKVVTGDVTKTLQECSYTLHQKLLES